MDFGGVFVAASVILMDDGETMGYHSDSNYCIRESARNLVQTVSAKDSKTILATINIMSNYV